MGSGENTLAAFSRAAETAGVDGVEFDIRRSSDGMLVVIHDLPQPGDVPDSLDAVLDRLRQTELGILAEIKEPGIGSDVIAAIRTHGLQERSVVFGFPKVAATLPWSKPRGLRLGIIVHLPWQADHLIKRYRPDVIMTGWDRRAWTRVAFRLWWSIFSLRRLGERHGAPVFGGVVRRRADLDWFKRQGVDLAVADLNVPDFEQLSRMAKKRKSRILADPA